MIGALPSYPVATTRDSLLSRYLSDMWRNVRAAGVRGCSDISDIPQPPESSLDLFFVRF